MQLSDLRRRLEDTAAAADWLRACGVQDVDRAHANLVRIASTNITLDLVADICDQLAEHLPRLSDADMALNNLDRFVAAARNPLSLATLFERDREALPILLQIFSTSQFFSDLLITDTEAYDLLRMTEGEPVARETIVKELAGEVVVLTDERLVMTTLRRFKRRELLRICYGDVIRSQRVETVTRQISYVADAVVESAVRAARKNLEEKRGVPRGATVRSRGSLSWRSENWGGPS